MTTADLIGKIVQLIAGIAVFVAVIGLILFFIDKAPKRGRDVLQLLLSDRNQATARHRRCCLLRFALVSLIVRV